MKIPFTFSHPTVCDSHVDLSLLSCIHDASPQGPSPTLQNQQSKFQKSSHADLCLILQIHWGCIVSTFHQMIHSIRIFSCFIWIFPLNSEIDNKGHSSLTLSSSLLACTCTTPANDLGNLSKTWCHAENDDSTGDEAL